LFWRYLCGCSLRPRQKDEYDMLTNLGNRLLFLRSKSMIKQSARNKFIQKVQWLPKKIPQ
jgi:hypothetical protein